MRRLKVDYGIDLGTTNSAIARLESGEAVIKKTDTLKDTLPSCVNFNKKKAVLVGDGAFNALKSDKLQALRKFEVGSSNTFIEFKRTMGTDKRFYSPNMDKHFSSEELSAEVLKRLKSFITDDTINSIVVTVPAKFTANQKDATIKAAKMAGFDHCELLQEPIAACMAYGLDTNEKHGNWLVFDFGGGTFDAALVKAEDGIIRVYDTAGDNYLGGKNIDLAIVDDIIIPYLNDNFSISSILDNDEKRVILRDAMKFYAEEAKIALSFNDSHNILSDLGSIPGEDEDGNEFELDITVTQDDFQKTIGPIFQKAADICKQLLERNGLTGKDLSALILVGGPTYSPVLRQLLREQITDKLDTRVDPMTAVARGAALYASTINISDEIVEKTRDRSKVQLWVSFESTTVELDEFVTIKLITEKMDRNIGDRIFAEIHRDDKAWASDKLEINDIGEVFEVKLIEGKPNTFSIRTFDAIGNYLECEPNSITIIQGSKIGSAILPYNLGIEVRDKVTGKMLFKTIKGLAINNSIPAVGVASDLQTQKAIRPGVKEDFIKIPLYQGDHGSERTNALDNEHIYDAIISGEHISKLLPEISSVELKINVDTSEQISLSAYFPYLDETVDIDVPRGTTQKEIDANWLESEITKSGQRLHLIQNDIDASNYSTVQNLISEIDELSKLLNQSRKDYDSKKQILDNLRKARKKIDLLQDTTEWPKTEEELKDSFYQLEKTFNQVEGKVEDIDDNKIKAAIAQFKEQIPQVIKEKNVKLAKELIDHIRGLDFAIINQAMGAHLEISILKQFNDDFDFLEWSNSSRARQLINEGLSLAVNNPSKQKLRPIVIELYKLLPKSDKPIIEGEDSYLTG
jgi:molecular chaperone DnaK